MTPIKPDAPEMPAEVRKRILVKGFEYGVINRKEGEPYHLRQDSYIDGRMEEYNHLSDENADLRTIIARQAKELTDQLKIISDQSDKILKLSKYEA